METRIPTSPTVKARASASYVRRSTGTTSTSRTASAPATVSTYEHRAVQVKHRAEASPAPLPATVSRTVKRRTSSPKPLPPAVDPAVKTPAKSRKKLALLLPGHNEELIIATTIQSAMAAGQKKRDIFVVDDNSSDRTRELAVVLLGEENVLSVERSGKALAVKKAVKHFNIERDYQWLHVADADSIFSADYFRVYRKALDPKKYAVAVGFVQSMRGNWISTYRALTYTFSQHVNRRIQSKLGMISVFPGPITCFRTDILSKLDFEAKTMTEDFDITLQVHRFNLGKIVYIPRAINYTQDPQSFQDFCKQTQRWQRGFFQGVKKYRIGLHSQRIDISLGFQMLQTIFFMFQLLVLIPVVLIATHNTLYVPVAVTVDFIINSAIAMWASAAIGRWNLLGAMPYFYFLRWVEIAIYLYSGFEILVLKKFQEEVKGWDTEGRRYALNASALQDIA